MKGILERDLSSVKIAFKLILILERDTFNLLKLHDHNQSLFHLAYIAKCGNMVMF